MVLEIFTMDVFKKRSSQKSASKYMVSNDNDEHDGEGLPEPPPPPPTDPRLPLNARQVFKLKKSWKGVGRDLIGAGVEMFVR